MRLNWITSLDTTNEMKKLYLDMEYKLREKISRFLIANWDELMDDFDKLVFDIDMATKEISISEDSPHYLKSIIQKDFHKEFSTNLYHKKVELDSW